MGSLIDRLLSGSVTQTAVPMPYEFDLALVAGVYYLAYNSRDANASTSLKHASTIDGLATASVDVSGLAPRYPSILSSGGQWHLWGGVPNPPYVIVHYTAPAWTGPWTFHDDSTGHFGNGSDYQVRACPDGSYVSGYTCLSPYGRIGCITAPTINGPWTDKGLIFSAVGEPVYGNSTCYDPTPMWYQSRLYMAFACADTGGVGHLALVELTPATGKALDQGTVLPSQAPGVPGSADSNPILLDDGTVQRLFWDGSYFGPQALYVRTAGGTMALLTDTFAGSSGTSLESHTADSGQSWTAMSAATCKLDGAGGVYSTTSSSIQYMLGSTVSSPDYQVQADLVAASIISGGYAGVVARSTGVGAFNEYVAAFVASDGAGNGTWRLTRYVSGTPTDEISVAGTVLTGHTYTVRLFTVGGNQAMAVSTDGGAFVPIGAVQSNATYASAGYAGLFFSGAAGSASTGMHAQNFSLTLLSGTTSTLYLHNAAAGYSGLPASYKGAWSAFSAACGASAKAMTTTVGASVANLASQAGTSGQYKLGAGQFLSPPLLAGQYIGGNWIAALAQATVNGQTCNTTVFIGVLDSTGALLGTFYPVNAMSSVAGNGGVMTEYLSGIGAATAFITAGGERLVAEIGGYENFGTISPLAVYFDGATAISSNGAANSTPAAFVSVTLPLTFAVTQNETLAGTAAASAALSVIATLLETLAGTAVASSALSPILQQAETIAATATAQATLTNLTQQLVSLAGSGTAAGDLVPTIGTALPQTLAGVATAAATLAVIAQQAASLVAQADSTAVLTPSVLTSLALASVAQAASSLAVAPSQSVPLPAAGTASAALAALLTQAESLAAGAQAGADLAVSIGGLTVQPVTLAASAGATAGLAASLTIAEAFAAMADAAGTLTAALSVPQVLGASASATASLLPNLAYLAGSLTASARATATLTVDTVPGAETLAATAQALATLTPFLERAVTLGAAAQARAGLALAGPAPRRIRVTGMRRVNHIVVTALEELAG